MTEIKVEFDNKMKNWKDIQKELKKNHEHLDEQEHKKYEEFLEEYERYNIVYKKMVLR